MTRLYSALDTAGVSSVAFQDDILANLNDDDDQKPSCWMQTADVAITRQWQLATHWWHALSENGYFSEKKDDARYVIQIIGLTAVQRTRLLRLGTCRIVGHGKLAALADTMFKISSALDILTCCSSLIRDMIRIVSKADCERSFAGGLSLIEICIEEVPRSVPSAPELAYDGGLENTTAELFLDN
ncbi:fungal zn2-cys6 binuclear cluster domain-containing [Trichoderma arundinaceum]|uniref:Fungal zn2-cys6 binuclear cluster domain-containing n=1 Tax=Trichoderma arundinaceum TaxID=490622 RepID=A0A395NFY2_TRIAR|nr:fungal zn2-cys6 binuclear cluster domain-containing [Trichoderma arundinaceum]